MSEISSTASTPTSGSSSTPSAAPSTPSATKTSTAPSTPAKPSLVPKPTPTQGAPKESSTPSTSPQTYSFTYKVDGKEKKFTGTEAELITHLQKGDASDARFREANALKKKLSEAITYGQQDRKQAIKAFEELFGHKFDEVAEEHLASRYEESTLSDEEKARRKELAEAKEAKEKLKQYETKAQAETRKKQEDALWAEMEKTYFGALEQLGYEKDPSILNLIADIDDAASADGYELSDKQLVIEANRRLEANAKHVMKRFTKPGSGPKLLEFLGADGVKAVIMAEMERRKMAVPGSEQTRTVESTNRSEPEKKLNPIEAQKKRAETRKSLFRMRMGLD